MPSQGPLFPSTATGTGTAVGGGTLGWANPGNISANDGVLATTSPPLTSGSQNSKDLAGTAFGFSVPAGATILGILLEVRYSSLNNSGFDALEKNVRLLKSGSAAGTDKGTTAFLPIDPTFTTVSYGGASDLWGTTWTAADINGSGFGAIVTYSVGSNTNGVNAEVDFIRITVTFSNAFSDTVTGAITAGATEAAKLAAVASESNNVALGVAQSAKLAAIASTANGVTLTDQETGVRTPTGITGNVLTGAAFSSQQTTSASELENVTLGYSVQGGIRLTGAESESVQVAGFMTAQLVHAPLPCSDISDYLSLITSEHNQRPKFMATVALLAQAFRDMQCLLKRFTTLFDIVQAKGDQLDILGLWIGVQRNLSIPLQNTVFFSWNTAGLGWGQGKWFGAGDTLTGFVNLSDEQYRTLLMARIASNMWDGTVPGAYAIWQTVLALQNFQLLIQDNQDMSISIIFLSNTVDAITQSLLVNGYLTFRPAGVRIAGYFKATPPVFGWGVQNNIIGGWGTGSWLQTTQIG